MSVSSPARQALPPIDSPRFDVPDDDAPRWPDAPETVRVMVVAPGPMFSTKDVWDGAVAGLTTLGVQVHPMDYHTDLKVMAAWERMQAEQGSDSSAQSFREFTLYASHRTVAHALIFRPHLTLFISGTIFPPPTAALLGRYAHTAVWLTESPYQVAQEEYVQAFYHSVFTNERTYVDRLRELRVQHDHPFPNAVAYLPHAFDPARHAPQDVRPGYESDVCFIGSPFPERQALFDGVDWTGIDARLIGVYAKPDIEETIDGPQGSVSNDVAHRYYAGAAININHHRRIRYYGHDEVIAEGEAESLNPRVYELAAAHCFQISDDSRPELGEILGESVPTYRWGDSADLERVIRYYLAHPEERARCAALAYERVQGHTVANRMRSVLNVCFRKD